MNDDTGRARVTSASAVRQAAALTFAVDRRSAVLLSAIIGFNALGSIATPVALSRLIDAVADRHFTAAIIAGVVAAVCQTVIESGFRIQFSMGRTLAERVDTELRREIGLRTASFEQLDLAENAEYRNRVEALRRAADGLASLSWSMVDVVSITVQIAVSLALLAMVNPALCGIVTLVVPSVLLARLASRIEHRGTVRASSHAIIERHLAGLTADWQSRSEIQLAGAGSQISSLAASQWNLASSILFRAQWAAAVVTLVGLACFTTGFLGALWISISEVVAGKQAVGVAVLIIVLAGRLHGQVNHAVWVIGRLMRSCQAAIDLSWLRSLREGSDEAHPVEMSDSITELTFNDVSFRYATADRDVLSDVSLTLKPGTTVAVVGHNGAGKTTLAKLLAKMYLPSGGEITVEGRNLSGLDAVGWRSALTAAFQDFVHWEFPLGTVVGIGSLAEVHDHDSVRHALSAVGADDIEAGLRLGLDQPIGDTVGGTQLSIGQWQKIALARAAMRSSAAVVILDEPTSALDAKAEAEMFERMRSLISERSPQSIVVLVSHRLSSVTMADLVVVLADGQIVDTGTPESLLSRPGYLREMYDLQARAYG